MYLYNVSRILLSDSKLDSVFTTSAIILLCYLHYIEDVPSYKNIMDICTLKKWRVSFLDLNECAE